MFGNNHRLRMGGTMTYATRLAGLAQSAARMLRKEKSSAVMLGVLAGALMLGGVYVNAQSRDADGVVAAFKARIAQAAFDDEVALAQRQVDAARAKAEATIRANDAEAAEQARLSAELEHVRAWVAEKYRVSGDVLAPAFAEAQASAAKAELDPLLLVAIMAVESSFNPMAKSQAGAVGLMQVIPRWHMDKIGEGKDHSVLFDPRLNVQVGTLVLREGLSRYGSLEAALQYYNGSRNDPEKRYTKRVLSVKRQLQQVLEQGVAQSTAG